MLPAELNIEGTTPATKSTDLSHIDRVEILKQHLQIGKGADRDGGASTASLDNLDPAALYAKSTGAGSTAKDGQTSKPAAGERHAAAGKNIGNVVPESQHTVAPGETIEGISRHALGPKASPEEVQRYAAALANANKIEDPTTMQAGQKIKLPGHDKNGTITFSNPDNANERWSVHADGTAEFHNKATGTSGKQTALDKFGSYKQHNKGPKPEDNFDVTYINKDHYTLTTRKDADGNTVATGSDGFRKVTDKNGNWDSTNAPSVDPASAHYDKASGVITQKFHDGSVIKIFDKDNHSEAVDPNGTKTTKWADGSIKVEKKDGQGHDIGSLRHPDGKGGYREHGWGPQPKDNYDETYNAKSGITSKVEAKGTADEKTTTRWADGTVRVEAKDGKNYQRSPDGAEHHWGKENYDKPAFDYKNDEHLKKSRETLTNAVHDHIPAGKQAAFRQDMANFEARARHDHLSPEEVAKTYDQMSRLLNTPEQNAVVSSANRALLAEGLIHQSADPTDTHQGNHNTCNVTAELKITLAKNPSKAAEIAATTAITGQWTAADGHVAKIDRQSLQPQAEESVYPPATSGDRSYATQVLNLAMVNDALQRRPTPETYVQRTPDRSNPDDTGERRLDAQGNVITANQYDANNNVWNMAPDASPGLSNREVAQVGARLNGESHVIAQQDPQGGVDSISSEKDLANKLHQLKNQGGFPVTIYVDAHHVPIQDAGKESPSYGAHFVTVDGYDEKTGRVHVSNQWGKPSSRWTTLKDLYGNASGTFSSKQDGVDTSDYQ